MNSNAIKVGAVSLGCSKNTVDTEIMLGELQANGFEPVADASLADIIIVNTCGFIESAKLDSIKTILEMAQYKESGNCRFLVMTGCLSQRYRDELPDELPEVDAWSAPCSAPHFIKTKSLSPRAWRAVFVRHSRMAAIMADLTSPLTGRSARPAGRSPLISICI